jgi:DNA invertase Pin-like site-specific DNA recombinase
MSTMAIDGGTIMISDCTVAKSFALTRHRWLPDFPKIRAHCGFRSTSAKTSNEIIRCSRSQLPRFAAPIVSLPPYQLASCEYADRESGAKRNRIEFQEMFRDAAHRRFDLLLFWSLDRFTREGVLETLTHLNRLTGAGVGYRSFTEPYFDSCGIFKDAVISILATIAKQERVRLSERVRAGLARARGRGKRLGRPKKIVDATGIAQLRSQGHSWREITEETETKAVTDAAFIRFRGPQALTDSKGTAQRTVASLPQNV